MCVYIYISIKGKHHADLEFELEEINLRIRNLCKRQPLAAEDFFLSLSLQICEDNHGS